MYWGKKIFEWSLMLEEVWCIVMMFNNRYLFDGWNMVFLIGVGWCFGLYDCEFYEASIIGTIRRFFEFGMRKKFLVGIKGYFECWGDDGGMKC